MGQLEEAAIKYPAPWADATPEEDAAYDKQVQWGNMEFEREVVEQGGPQLIEHVDADRATMMLKGGWNLGGMYNPPDTKPVTQENKRYGKVLRRAGLEELEPDTVYAVGPERATADLWAHEFGHRRYEYEGLSSWLGEEKSILLHDAFRVDNPKEWSRAVRFWDSQYDFDSMEEAEKHLLRMLDSWGPDLIKAEARANEERGNVAKKREGFFTTESHRKDAEEAMERRKKSWSLKKYIGEYREQ